MAFGQPLLEISDLTVSYRTRRGTLTALREFSMAILPGQTYGLVGESGSGKTTLALAVMNYLGRDGLISKGTVRLDGKDLSQLGSRQLRRLWGKEIAFVPQNPFAAMNPTLPIDEQLVEALQLGGGLTRHEAKEAIPGLLEQVGLANPSRVARSFPHQISGGMQQRVMIAMALGNKPRLFVLDEPTAALDVTTEATVLDLLRELVAHKDRAALYISHNLGVVATLTDRVSVLYASELVEDAPTRDLFRQPLHPYTRGLLDSVPRLSQRRVDRPLLGIAGQIPSLEDLPKGCIFAPRCPLAIEKCWEERPPLEKPAENRQVRCHRWPEILAGEVSASRAAGAAVVVEEKSTEIVLQVDSLGVRYPLKRSLGQIVLGKPRKVEQAVEDITLKLRARQTLGIVGESGGGKSSLARAIIGLVERSAGEIDLLGFSLPSSLKGRSREVLSHLQMVFQNPEEALNPYLTVAESLRRPLRLLQGYRHEQAQGQVAKLLESVRLPLEYARRLPGQLSGGERQRVAIARAFASHPDLLIADEPVSALDVSVRATILNLLADMQSEHDSAMILIAHDIAAVGYLADSIAVMYLGRLMQTTDTSTLFEPPYHPYTEALLSAVPPPDPFVMQERIRLSGEMPGMVEAPGGCPFHTRCPRFLGDICIEETPPWRETSDGKRYFCHIAVDDLLAQQSAVLIFDSHGNSQD